MIWTITNMLMRIYRSATIVSGSGLKRKNSDFTSLRELVCSVFSLPKQWNLCNPTSEFSDILWHPTKIDSPKVFLSTKIKPEYSDILYNPTHFPGSLVCLIRQFHCTIENIQLMLRKRTISYIDLFWMLL